MAGSAAERELRDAVVVHLRQLLPTARIVHELVVGQCRADLAVIETDRITALELKSKRDKLDRLERQVREFARCCHDVVVVADRRWYVTKDAPDGGKFMRPSDGLSIKQSAVELWPYPPAEPGEFAYAWMHKWSLPRVPRLRQPRAYDMLSLLWRAELAEECHRHRISASSRSTCDDMITTMAWHMKGREIAEAVCRQLRRRPFPEADAPIG